jgi:hypothetical protein
MSVGDGADLAAPEAAAVGVVVAAAARRLLSRLHIVTVSYFAPRPRIGAGACLQQQRCLRAPKPDIKSFEGGKHMVFPAVSRVNTHGNRFRPWPL